MRADHWRTVAELAERQAGLVTSDQLRMAGACPTAVDDFIRDGRLIQVRRRVLAVAGAPIDAARPVRAAALAIPNSVVTHRSAAWLHGLMSRRPSLVDLALPNRKVIAIGVLGRQADIADEHIAEADGIPVTSVPWTLVDLMASLPPDWTERLVNDAVMRRLCGYDDVRAVAESRPDDECGAAMTGLLHGLDGTTPLEGRWARILRAAGLPQPRRQFQVVLGDQVYVLDFAWPEHLVAFEVDGFAFHRTRDAFDRDHDKVVALQAAGWNVVCATAKTPPAPVLTALKLGVSGRGWRGG